MLRAEEAEKNYLTNKGASSDNGTLSGIPTAF